MTQLVRWLKIHNKGDLFECNWQEIKEALAAAGHGCPMADYAIEGGKEEERRLNTITSPSEALEALLVAENKLKKVTSIIEQMQTIGNHFPLAVWLHQLEDVLYSGEEAKR